MNIKLKFMDSLVNKLRIKTSCGIEKYNKLKMNKTFFANKKYNKYLGINYDNFLKNSLKKFVEYNR